MEKLTTLVQSCSSWGGRSRMNELHELLVSVSLHHSASCLWGHLSKRPTKDWLGRTFLSNNYSMLISHCWPYFFAYVTILINKKYNREQILIALTSNNTKEEICSMMNLFYIFTIKYRMLWKFHNRVKLTSSYTCTVNGHNHWFWTLHKETQETRWNMICVLR